MITRINDSRRVSEQKYEQDAAENVGNDADSILGRVGSHA